MTLAFVINVTEDQNVVLRKVSNSGDGSCRKGMKCGESLSLKWGRSCSSGNVKSLGRAEHRLTQDTKVKRQIPFLGEFPVRIRKLGVAVPARARTHPRWCSVVLMARSWEALTT